MLTHDYPPGFELEPFRVPMYHDTNLNFIG